MLFKLFSPFGDLTFFFFLFSHLACIPCSSLAFLSRLVPFTVLQYAELKPVPCLTYSDAQKLRETSATPILRQVRNDVIRYRYGDEQHLEEALKRIFQYGLVGSATSFYATCNFWMVTEDGKYCLVLVFEAKALQLSDFEKRQAKFASFFGPGITAEVGEF
ncbi:unnamed protein product, partial [Vitis vinifera]